MKRKRTKSERLRSTFTGVIDEKLRIVNIHSASKFYRQVPLDRIEPEIKRVAREAVQLSEGLFEEFLKNLEFVSQQEQLFHLPNGKTLPSKVGPADLAAHALLLTAQFYRHKNPTFEWSVWPSDRPMNEAWEYMGALAIPSTICISKSQRLSGLRGRILRPVAKADDLKQGCERLEVTHAHVKDTSRPPRLVITLEGQPVCALLKVGGRVLGSSVSPETKQYADVVLKSVFSALSRSLGIKQSTASRPDEGLGPFAAYMRDHLCMKPREIEGHLGKPWKTLQVQIGQHYRRQKAQLKARPLR